MRTLLTWRTLDTFDGSSRIGETTRRTVVTHCVGWIRPYLKQKISYWSSGRKNHSRSLPLQPECNYRRLNIYRISYFGGYIRWHWHSQQNNQKPILWPYLANFGSYLAEITFFQPLRSRIRYHAWLLLYAKLEKLNDAISIKWPKTSFLSPIFTTFGHFWAKMYFLNRPTSLFYTSLDAIKS